MEAGIGTVRSPRVVPGWMILRRDEKYASFFLPVLGMIARGLVTYLDLI